MDTGNTNFHTTRAKTHTLTKKVRLEYFREIFTSSIFKGGVSIKAFLVDKLKL